MFGRKGITAVAAASVAAVGLAGCTYGAGEEGGAPSAVSTDVGTSCDVYGDITMKVGFSEAGEAIADGFNELVAQFEEENANVTIELQAKDWASSQQTIRLVMSSNDPLDVVQGNSGFAINGALWRAGLIADLDPYAELYGWEDEFPESALTVNRFSDDGMVLGEGNLVALTQAIQYVGVFYNKQILADLGVTDPSTLDDKETFLATLEQAKAAGITPVMLGDSDKWPALHNLSLFNGWYEDPETINEWVFNAPGATYETPGRLQGSTDFQDWYENGYFNEDALATSFSDATARFGNGEAAFFVTGTWALGDVTDSLGEDAGFMLWPAGEAGTHAAPGGYSLPFAMSSKTEYPDCAAAFIDFVTTSDEAIDSQIAAGRPAAVTKGLEAQIDDPLLSQMVSEYERLNADEGLFTWEDWPSPTMLEYQGSEAQRLLLGQVTPEEFNAGVQANWGEYMAERTE